jgi:hypothetical protein
VNALYEKVNARVPAIVAQLLEEYRVQQLTNAPERARWCFDGDGWKNFLTTTPGTELRVRLQAKSWNMAMCEIITVLAESDVELERRIDALETKGIGA